MVSAEKNIHYFQLISALGYVYFLNLLSGKHKQLNDFNAFNTNVFYLGECQDNYFMHICEISADNNTLFFSGLDYVYFLNLLSEKHNQLKEFSPLQTNV